MSRTRPYLDMKSHPIMIGTDNSSTTRKVWLAENSPNVMVANDVPNGMKDLLSALMSWMLFSGESLPMLMCFLLITEQEAPESKSNCVGWSLILPVIYAGMCCVVRALTKVGVHPQLAGLGCPLGRFPVACSSNCVPSVLFSHN